MAICIDTIEPGVQYVMIVKNTWVGWHIAATGIVTPRTDATHAFSPCIVATTFLWCLAALNSRYHTPCHVPVASFPSFMGIVTLAPINALLICAYSLLANISPKPLLGAYRHVIQTLRRVSV